VRRALFAATMILAACAIVAAAEELSEQSKQKIARIREEVRKRVEQAPLTLDELCRIDPQTMDEEEIRRRIRATTYPGMPGPYMEKDNQKINYPVPDRDPII